MAKLTGKQIDIFGSTDNVMDLPLFGGANVVTQEDGFTVERPAPAAGEQLDMTVPEQLDIPAVFEAGWIFTESNDPELIRETPYSSPVWSIETPHESTYNRRWYRDEIDAVRHMIELETGEPTSRAGADVWMDREADARNSR